MLLLLMRVFPQVAYVLLCCLCAMHLPHASSSVFPLRQGMEDAFLLTSFVIMFSTPSAFCVALSNQSTGLPLGWEGMSVALWDFLRCCRCFKSVVSNAVWECVGLSGPWALQIGTVDCCLSKRARAVLLFAVVATITPLSVLHSLSVLHYIERLLLVSSW